ncbi:MAG TPA: hypothetical protein DEA40_11510 [Parvularcula sp.]|nr:hypothetical protein [Parvularcula sp.]
MGLRSVNRQRIVLVAVLAMAAALFLRALIPIGYMVSFNGDAFALIPCEGVTSIAFAGAAGASAHHQHHSAGHDQGGLEHEPAQPSTHYSACPFATSCCAVSVAPAGVPAPSLQPASEVISLVLRYLAVYHARPFLARAPPLVA